jgi:vancomycin resistance protein VanJ
LFATTYAAAVVTAAILLRAATDAWWPATVLAFGPRWLLALPLPLVVLAVGLTRRWRLLAPLLVATGALFVAIDFRIPFGRRAGAGQPLSVLTLNAQGEHASPARLRRVLEAEAIQIAAIQECDLDPRDWNDGAWRFQRTAGTCLLSRFPIGDAEARVPAGDEAPNVAVRYLVEAPGGPIAIVALHLPTPREGLEEVIEHGLRGGAAMTANSAMRERASAAILVWFDRVAAGPRTIVMGDLNMPVESAIYRRQWSSFANAFSRCGFGLGWSKRTRWFGARIDHVLLTDAFGCASAALAPDVGSDHRGVIARLTAR